MSTSTPKQTNENEEIDLGVLFNSIGRGISKVFNAIGAVIMFVLNTLLALTVFVRKRIVNFVIAAVIGLLIGVATEFVLPKQYVATATLEPHFDSARQLYSNVTYLNDLAGQRDSIQLASFFNISPEEAATISKIEISPLITEARLLKEYNDYVVELDSLVATEITFKDYTKQLDDYERKDHILKVKSSKDDVFSKLLSPIVASVSEVKYFREKQQTQLKSLELSDSITQVSMAQTDSLLALFEEVRLVEANKEFSNGTNVYMSQKAEDNTEISLLERKIDLADLLEEIRLQKLKARSVVDIVSAFPQKGYLETGLLKNKKIVGALIGVLFLFIFYGVIFLDKFLVAKNNS